MIRGINIQPNIMRNVVMVVVRKRGAYRERWLKEHPRITLYLTKEEYDLLKMSGKPLKETILDGVRHVVGSLGTAYEKGRNDMLDFFIERPRDFYRFVMERARERGLSDFTPALFTFPCDVCYKPTLCTHGDSNWESEIKPILLKAFERWGHSECHSRLR